MLAVARSILAFKSRKSIANRLLFRHRPCLHRAIDSARGFPALRTRRRWQQEWPPSLRSRLSAQESPAPQSQHWRDPTPSSNHRATSRRNGPSHPPRQIPECTAGSDDDAGVAPLAQRSTAPAVRHQGIPATPHFGVWRILPLPITSLASDFSAPHMVDRPNPASLSRSPCGLDASQPSRLPALHLQRIIVGQTCGQHPASQMAFRSLPVVDPLVWIRGHSDSACHGNETPIAVSRTTGYYHSEPRVVWNTRREKP